MNWKDLGKTVAKFAPLLGDLLPIPGAGIAGKLIASAFGVDNTPDAIAQAIAADPDAGIKLATIESNNRAALEGQLIAAETARIQSVNQTMQAEAKSEHWMQWAWRPFNGFLFGITLFMVYALPSIINTFAPLWVRPVIETVVRNGLEVRMAIATWIPIEISHVPEVVFMAWGAVLGVTAWHRGKNKGPTL